VTRVDFRVVTFAFEPLAHVFDFASARKARIFVGLRVGAKRLDEAVHLLGISPSLPCGSSSGKGVLSFSAT
jgi:hypothetical protein